MKGGGRGGAVDACWKQKNDFELLIMVSDAFLGVMESITDRGFYFMEKMPFGAQC
jgi:hypothetical protein